MKILKQPTILGLMILIAYLAIGMAAVRSNSDTWAGIVMYLTVFILCFASLVAIYRRGAWAGFAIFGWANFVIFHLNAAERAASSILIRLAVHLVRPFTQGNLPYHSLSSILSLSSVAVGFLGAFVGWLVGRECETSRRDHASSDSDHGAPYP